MEAALLKIIKILPLLILTLSLGVAHADSMAEETRAFLQEFKTNPEKAMGERLPKRDIQGNPIDHLETVFTPEAIKNGAFVDAKDEVRQHFCTLVDGYRECLGDYLPGMAPFAESDRVENMVELPSIVRNPGEMEKLGLLSTELTKLPWSDSYWPMNKGLTGIRYADPLFPDSPDWTVNYAYVQAHPPGAIFATSDGANLSPTEKYDYLVGDNSYALTQTSWARGKALFDTWHVVQSWDGICDGWSAASIMDPEPIHMIYATASNGKKIPFYPSDVKGLASLLWATGQNTTRFIGNRCNTRNPSRDDVGRTVAAKCFDTNPGTFHMAVVNQLGVAKRPFIMDAVYDFEIWNYPVWMYKYSYFNPQTLSPVTNWRDARVDMADFHTDRFAKYRSPNAKYLIGISMFVTYMVELVPTHYEGHHSAPRTVHYLYDLELDANQNIIGGEWYTTTQHPDFLWTPPQGSKAKSFADSSLFDMAWSTENPVPQSWVTSAALASQASQPLGVVIDQLVKHSSQ